MVIVFLKGLLVFEGLMVLHWWISRLEHTDTDRRIRHHFGHKERLSFWGHPGLVGDIVAISALLSWWIASYGSIWFSHPWSRGVWISIVVASIVAVGATIGWARSTKGKVEVHGINGKLTGASVIHCLYMIPALTLCFLFYFGVGGIKVSLKAAVICSVILGGHIALSTGIIEKLRMWVNPPHASLWRLIGLEKILMIAVVWGLLAWCTWRLVNISEMSGINR